MRTGTITAKDHCQKNNLTTLEKWREEERKYANVKVVWDERQQCYQRQTAGIKVREEGGWLIPLPGQLISYRIATAPAEANGAIIWD